MAGKTVEPADEREDRPALGVYPPSVLEGDQIIVRGSGWGDHSIKIDIDGKAVTPFRILLGFPTSKGVLPDAAGSFVVRISTLGMKSGKHRMATTSLRRSPKARAARTFEVFERPRFDPDGRRVDKPYFRDLDFFVRRFGHIGFVPPGVRHTQISEIRRLREKRNNAKRNLFQEKDPSVLLSAPIPGVCNWNPVGAGPVPKGQTQGTPQQAVSGRTLAIAIDPNSPFTVYIGTANGGVWKSTDEGTTWSPKTDYAMSPAVGALAIDPSDSSRVFAGTGEYKWPSLGLQYYGSGILRSEDGGETWTELATTTFERDEISRILFDPTDPTSQRMFLSSNTGVYESSDGGVNWTQLRAGSASDLVITVESVGPPVTLRLIAGFAVEGLWTSTGVGSAWSAWTEISSPAFPSGFSRIALGQSRNNPLAIYAAFSKGNWYLAGIAKTTDGGANWTSVSGPPQPSAQTGYNFHISVHPDGSDIVYYGEVRLWRTNDGGASWVDITDGEPTSPTPPGTPIGIHVDQHGFAFDPTNADIVWAGNDGGVYRSKDGGATWTHRNRDLATLQYIHISQHPQWEAVILGGTQDNGTHRYSGNPAWYFSIGGDGGFTGIDPNTPTRMYRGYIENSIYRSEQAGEAGTWQEKTGSITGNAMIYPPFTLDPSNPDVCYFGNDKLWRSPNNGDAWEAITDTLFGLITAVAVHPADSNTIYVGTVMGKVYHVHKTGATWTLPDVTTTDLTAPELPVAIAVSDIAVDTAGTVWVTSASVRWSEATGEFTNNHVFRRTAGGTGWETRSNGLAQGNPINTIVIDPVNENRLFCGGDIGVFRTEDAGENWEPWDEGLPNVPVFHLAIHQPRRLVRAATHGRSVWERPIDIVTCPMVDLYIRDNILDTGRVQPSPSGHPHPFDPSTTVYWWQSVDIKIDAPKLTYQTPEPVTDYVSFEGDLQHRDARRGAKNRLYVQVHNRGVGKATNVRVRVFVANTSDGYPALPGDFWSAGKPFNADPSSGKWTPVGPAKSIAVLEPAEPAVFYWPWQVHKHAPADLSLLALVTCDEDPLVGAGIYDVATLVQDRKQAALKKIKVIGRAKKSKPKKTKPKKPVHPKVKKGKPKKTKRKKRK